MMGATGFKGASMATAIARQRLTAFPRSSRLMSTFRTQRVRLPGTSAQLIPGFSGNASRWATPAIAGPAAIRFNSSLSDPAAPGQLTAIDDLSSIDIASLPEQIGYLKTLGLDYGWGITSIMQWSLEHIHMYTGLPWWASIVGLGLMVRLALLKPMLDASHNGAKLNNLKSVTNPVRQKMMRAAQAGDNTEVQRCRAELSQINRDNGIKLYKSFVPMLQIPLGFAMFRIIRGMTTLPVPALLNEHVLWMTDLTVADPFLILPAISSFCLYLTFKKGGEVGMAELMKGPAGKGLLIGLPVLTMAFTAFMPSALQLYFAATGVWACVQAHIVNNPTFRRMAHMETFQNVQETKAAEDSLSQLTLRLQQEQQKRLRELQAQDGEVDASKISAIDRWMKGGKDYFKALREQISKAANTSRGPDTNADGSPAAPPRLTEAQRKRATKEEEEQAAWEAEERERRNEERRLAHKRALENDRERAKSSLRRHQEKARRN
ncbi:hypothetical protein N7520_006961 [Penicillium odoratum]|uniref:uncharacterized protein n=1 Tax=Penicillium odoratum TaxID=1167516 RepID=UPI0025468376|nr:uncharacterized protein N7520_006961 [Penicillium odoratum]KAJ5759805.1 hypothetical protein N7520_006961 [Penicillium odoratum]